MGGSENDYLEVLVRFFKALHDVGADVNTRVNGFFVWEVDFEDDIGVLGFDVVDTMDEGFVHVENYELFLGVGDPWRRELYKEIFHFFWLYHSDIILDELKGLHCLHEVLLVQVLLVFTATTHFGYFCDKLIQRIARLRFNSTCLEWISLSCLHRWIRLIWQNGVVLERLRLIIIVNVHLIVFSALTGGLLLYNLKALRVFV